MISKLCTFIASVDKDKLLHFIISYIIFDFCLSILCRFPLPTFINILTSFTIVSVFIVGKEIIDKIDYNGFDWKDILAGYLGVLVKLILFIIMIL